jgi:hypothetical protein
MTRVERHAQIKRLKDAGLTFDEIAAGLGIARSTATDAYYDPTGEKARARKAKNNGRCVDCGVETKNSGGKIPPARCRPCAGIATGAARKVWTREAIVGAICAWANEHGEPPASSDWNPWGARNNLHDEARARRDEEAGDRWPGFTTVIRAFGSWNSAMQAAGYGTRPAHGGGENVARRRSSRERAVV